MHPAAAAVAVRPVDAHRMPLRLMDLNIGNAFCEWNTQKDTLLFKYMTAIASEHSGIASVSGTYARLVLLCALLEDASADIIKSGSDKYVALFREWAHLTTQEALLEVARVGSLEEFGALLSDLRNEIVHPRRPRKALLAHHAHDLYYLCQIVEAALFSYSLSLLGVDREASIRAQHELF
jgi:hypothetical protein